MYFYADRILIQILAFSLAPVLGLAITAIANPVLGLIIGIVSFSCIFCQPNFSDMCLKNTAEGLGLINVVCAEGQVTYFGASFNEKGKLFLTQEALVLVKDNQIELRVPLSSIVESTVQIEEMLDIKEYAPILEKKSPNLPQLVSMMGMSTNKLSGYLVLRIKQHIFFNTYCFQVSYPDLWKENLKKMLVQ